MTVERWRQIEQLYHQALGCLADQRSAFLAEACAGDPSLRGEVEALLAANDQATGFLGTPALELEAKQLAAEKVTARLAPSLGQSFNHYTILSLLGAGGMGEVWLARDTRLDRQVALKLLPVQFTSDTHRLQRFIREARAASALNHPNIITIHEIGEATTAEGKTHFITTEFIAGQTLRQWMAEGERPLRQVLDVAIQVAAALDAAHNAGIVHRDIKPENIMVRPDGLVKVLDFGLAKLTAQNSSAPAAVNTDAETLPPVLKTQPGMILGTLRYMSPEQARGRDVDARTDIFSLGVVLYEMVSGQPLFAGDNSADVIAAIIHKEPPPLADLIPGTPPELERIVGKSLAKECRDRYQTARDLQIDLQHLKQESELSARLARSGSSYSPGKLSAASSSANSPASQAPPRLSRRHALLALPVIALLAGALYWLAFRRGGQVETPPLDTLKPVEVVRWQSAPGEIYSAGVFSRDSQWVAFTSAKSGSRNIWIKQVASGQDHQSTNDEFGNKNPIWSPDGTELAFFSLRNGLPGIWRMPQLGGQPHLIKTLTTGEGDINLKHWSKDGSTLYYEWKKNLFTLDANSGQTKQLTTFDAANINVGYFSISPDEQHFAYIVGSDGHNSLWYAPMRGGESRQVAADFNGARNTAWHSDGKRIFFSASVNGTFQIFAADIKADKPVQITFGETDSLVLDVSADGAKILYGSSKEESDIWGVPVASRQEFAVASDLDAELWPDVSPDGKAIAYQSIKNLSQGNKLNSGSILTQSVEPNSPPFPLATNGFLPQWSPDGKKVAFLRKLANATNLWIVNALGGEEKQLTTAGLTSVDSSVLPYNRAQASNYGWSPDGGTLAYYANRGGLSNLWLISADGQQDTQITQNTDANILVYCPLWSADGKQIAFSTRPNRANAEGRVDVSFWVIETETKTSRAVFQADTSRVRLLGWSQSGRELVFARFNGTSPAQPSDINLFRVALNTGAQTQIALLPSTYFYNVHLSPDKRMIAFVTHQDGKDNVWTVSAAAGKPLKLTANNDARLFFSNLAWSPDGQTIYFGKQSRYSLLSMIASFN